MPEKSGLYEQQGLKRGNEMNTDDEERSLESVRIPWILFNIAFEPGECLDSIRHIKDPMLRDMALIEYYYFTGECERAVSKVVKYLHHEELKTRLGAWVIHVFGHMTLGNIEKARYGMEQLQHLVEQYADGSHDPNTQIHFSAVKRMLDLQEGEKRLDLSELVDCGDESGRLILCFLMEEEAKEAGEYERVIGVTDAIMLLSRKRYPFLFLHLYLIAANACLNLKRVESGEAYFEKAWELIRADGFYGAFSQYCGGHQVFLEKIVRKQDPAAYKKIMEIIDQYMNSRESLMSNNWGGIFSEAFQKLTGMEYAVAQLAAKKWSNQEIADYLGISLRTVKYHMSSVFNKLGIDSRRELEENP